MITKEQIEALGWTMSDVGGVYYMKMKSKVKYELYNFPDSIKAISINILLPEGHAMHNKHGYEFFRGQLITDDPQKELALIMEQIGINREE